MGPEAGLAMSSCSWRCVHEDQGDANLLMSFNLCNQCSCSDGAAPLYTRPTDWRGPT